MSPVAIPIYYSTITVETDNLTEDESCFVPSASLTPVSLPGIVIRCMSSLQPGRVSHRTYPVTAVVCVGADLPFGIVTVCRFPLPVVTKRTTLLAGFVIVVILFELSYVNEVNRLDASVIRGQSPRAVISECYCVPGRIHDSAHLARCDSACSIVVCLV